MYRPVDLIALILASTIAITLIVTSVIPLVTGEPITETRSKNIASIFDTLIGALIAYIGMRVKDRSDGDG